MRRSASSLGDLDVLLSAADALALFREAGLPVEGVDPEHLRLKPDTTALVAYRITGRGPDGEQVSLPAYVRTFPNGRGWDLSQKWSRMRQSHTPLGRGVRLLPGGHSVLFLFPNDARLRGLRFVAELDKVKRILSRLEDFELGDLQVRGHRSTLTPIRYKPERRFIARACLFLRHPATGASSRARLFLRFFPDQRGRRIAQVTELAWTEGGDLVPRPLGTLLDGRLFVEEEVDGQPILPAILAEAADAEALAHRLRRLHQLPPPGKPIRPAHRVAATMQGLAALVSGDEGLRSLLDPLAARFRTMRLPDPTSALVHGDLHLHQVLLAREGPVFVDFERAAVGHPLQDVADLVAHLREVAEGEREQARALHRFEERFLESYFRANDDADPGDLPFFIASALADRALLRLRHPTGDRVDRAAKVLALAHEASLEALSGERPGPASRSASPGNHRPSFFSREDPLSGEFVWQVFSPRPRGGPWPGFLEDPTGARLYALYEAGRDHVRVVSPDDDPRLPGLAEWLEKGTLVAYRPGRRATLRLDDPRPCYAKILGRRKAEAVAKRHRCVGVIMDGTPGVPALAPLREARPGEGVLLFESVPGRSLHRLLMDSSLDARPALDATGRALAAFHAAPTSGALVPRDHGRIELEAYALIAERHFPAWGESYRDVLVRISRMSGREVATPPGVIHGDLHDRNVFVDGDRVAFVDLDAARVGDPAEDIGNLAAHLLLRALQRGGGVSPGRRQVNELVRAYRLGGSSIQADPLRLVVAESLLRLACIYAFRRRWQRLVPSLLFEARRWTLHVAWEGWR